MAKPLISCELGTGTSYINKHGETGQVVEAANALALRGALENISSQDSLAATMGRAARKQYEENFTAEEMGNKYLQLYKKTLENIVSADREVSR
jgi:glycosyltransferase involved in cell wall biosynthesis